MTAAIADANIIAPATAVSGAVIAALELAAPGRGLDSGSSRPYLAPVPDSAPPFDDEILTPGSRAVHGPRPTGAATIGNPFFGPAPASNGPVGRAPITQPNDASPLPVARPIRSTIRAAGVPSWSSEADIGVVRTATAELPPVQRAASVLARAVIEVVAGHRPVAQLRVHCSPAIYAGLGPRHAAMPRSLPHLLSVRVCEPADGVAEVSAVFRRSERVRALAFRLQGVDGRWRITALQLG